MSEKPMIMAFTLDCGGANNIAALAEELTHGFNVIFFAGESSYFHLKRIAPDIKVNRLCKSTQYSTSTFREVISLNKPQAVITDTSARNYSSRSVWLACKQLGVPSIAILDQWVNYSLRFLKKHHNYQAQKTYLLNDYLLPEAIVVMNQYAKKEMIKEGFPRGIIYPLGSPYYHKLETLKLIRNYNHRSTCRVLFASEPISQVYGHALGKSIYGYTERTVIHALCQQVESFQWRKNIKIIIKPHPNEPCSRYNSLLKRYKFTELCSQYTTEQSIKNADIVLGMTTTMLIEAAILSRPIASLQIGNHDRNYFYLEQIGILKSIRYRYNLESLMRDINLGQLNKYLLTTTAINPKNCMSISELIINICSQQAS